MLAGELRPKRGDAPRSSTMVSVPVPQSVLDADGAAADFGGVFDALLDDHDVLAVAVVRVQSDHTLAYVERALLVVLLLLCHLHASVLLLLLLLLLSRDYARVLLLLLLLLLLLRLATPAPTRTATSTDRLSPPLSSKVRRP